MELDCLLKEKLFPKKYMNFNFSKITKRHKLQAIIKSELDGTNLMTCPVIWWSTEQLGLSEPLTLSANVLYIFCIVRSLFCWKADITQCNSDSISNTNALCVIISRVTKSGATVRADTWGDFWSRPPSVVDQPLKKLHRSINCCTGKAKLIIRYFLLDKFW